MAAAYAVVGWLLIQVVTQVFPIFRLPDWVDQAIVLLILTAFRLSWCWRGPSMPPGRAWRAQAVLKKTGLPYTPPQIAAP